MINLVTIEALTDELEKISENRLQRAIRLGEIGVDEVKRLLKDSPRGEGIVQFQNVGARPDGTTIQRLKKIKMKRLINKGVDPEEAKRMVSKPNPRYSDDLSTLRGGELRQDLKLSAAKSKGLDDDALYKVQRQARKEDQILRGELAPEGSVRGAADDLDRLTPAEKQLMQQRTEHLGVKAQRGGMATPRRPVAKGSDFSTTVVPRAEAGGASPEAVEALQRRMPRLSPAERIVMESPDEAVKEYAKGVAGRNPYYDPLSVPLARTMKDQSPEGTAAAARVFRRAELAREASEKAVREAEANAAKETRRQLRMAREQKVRDEVSRLNAGKQQEFKPLGAEDIRRVEPRSVEPQRVEPRSFEPRRVELRRGAAKPAAAPQPAPTPLPAQAPAPAAPPSGGVNPYLVGGGIAATATAGGLGGYALNKRRQAQLAQQAQPEMPPEEMQ